MTRAWILLPVLTALAGCAAARTPLTDAMAAAAPDAETARALRVQRLGRDLARATTAPEGIDVGLSSRDALGAWSWPDGRIRVSRTLADLLDDDELRAALAHEIGHLLDAGHVAGEAAALAGAASGGRHETSGVESRADARACALLRARGAPIDALPRMLRTVARSLTPDDDGPDPAALRARASAAERDCTASR